MSSVLPTSSSHASSGMPRELLSIQYLRAVAALMVVGFHVRPRLLRMGWDGSWPEWLGCGVDIFFVISGTIMWLTTCERAVTPQQFLLRRLLRIAPLYYAVTALVVVLMAVAPALVAGGRIDTTHILASFAFLPAAHPIFGTFEPVLPQGWTLNYEMEFYLLFALTLFAPKNIRPWLLMFALVAIVLMGLGSDPKSIVGFYSSSIILEFGFGLFIGIALTNGARLSKPVACVLLIAGLIGMAATWPLVAAGIPRVCFCGTCAAMIVGGAVFLEMQGSVARNRLLHLLGDASYSIYLTHGLVMSAVGTIWMRAGLLSPTALIVFVPVSVLGATLAGTLVYRFVEKPLHDLSRKAFRTKRVVTA